MKKLLLKRLIICLLCNRLIVLINWKNKKILMKLKIWRFNLLLKYIINRHDNCLIKCLEILILMVIYLKLMINSNKLI